MDLYGQMNFEIATSCLRQEVKKSLLIESYDLVS